MSADHDLPAIVTGLAINGNGFTLNANGNRGFFAYSGTSSISDLTITGAIATGGAGGGGFGGGDGGGGAGLGGGLFVAAAASVTTSNLQIASNEAIGGAGGSNSGFTGGGGGGGLGAPEVDRLLPTREEGRRRWKYCDRRDRRVRRRRNRDWGRGRR